jgi:broad specificity phosphatase PhoE
MSDHAVALSENGKAQAAQAGAFLRELFAREGAARTHIMTSPYKRARDTAEILVESSAGAGFASLSEDISLTEMQFGLFEGMTVPQISAAFPVEHRHFEKAIQSG